jgi:predicted PurR-regulated permease PerM
VYGTIFAGNTHPQSTYSIDGTVLASYIEPSDNYTHYNQLLWQSQTLSNSAHAIVVTYHDGIGFWLDYMQYTTQAASPSPSTTSQFSTPLSQATSSPVLTSSQSTPTPAASSSNKNLIGPIVGGVVGGLLLLFLLVCFLLRRMRRSREKIEEPVSRATSPISMCIPIQSMYIPH